MVEKAAAKPTLRAMFDRLDCDGTKDVDDEKVETYLEDLGIENGWFDNRIGRSVDMFMEQFEAGPARRVSWSRFVEGGKHLLPPSVLDERGHLSRARAEGLFAEIAGGKDRASVEELVAYLEREISANAQTMLVSMFAGTIAQVAARIAVDALDGDRDTEFTERDIFDLIDDINREMAELTKA